MFRLMCIVSAIAALATVAYAVTRTHNAITYFAIASIIVLIRLISVLISLILICIIFEITFSILVAFASY